MCHRTSAVASTSAIRAVERARSVREVHAEFGIERGLALPVGIGEHADDVPHQTISGPISQGPVQRVTSENAGGPRA